VVARGVAKSIDHLPDPAVTPLPRLARRHLLAPLS
jgi:hypothetical protein